MNTQMIRISQIGTTVLLSTILTACGAKLDGTLVTPASSNDLPATPIIPSIPAPDLSAPVSDNADTSTTDSLGNTYIVETSSEIEGQVNSEDSKLLLAKIDLSGEVQWTAPTVDNPNSEATAITVDPNGDIYVAGYTELSSSPEALQPALDYFLIKYDSSGTQQWIVESGIQPADLVGYTEAVESAAEPTTIVTSITADAVGNVLVAGDVYQAVDGGTAEIQHSFVTKYNASGLRQPTEIYKGRKVNRGQAALILKKHSGKKTSKH